MKSKLDLGLDNMLLDYYSIQFDCIKSYFDILNKSVNNENTRILSLADYLRGKGATEEYIVETLDEDSFNYDFFESNVYNYAIVFLFSECEKLIKQDYGILSWKSSKTLFKFDNVKKMFKEEGINITSFLHYQEFNEIRILNNCIKHDGYPNTELCKVNSTRWKEDEKIELTYSELQNYLTVAKSFFDELIPTIKLKEKEKLLKEDVDLIERIYQKNLKTLSSEESNCMNAILYKLKKL